MPKRNLLTLVFMLAAAQGCDASEPCDSDQVFEGSVCAPAARAAGAGTGGSHAASAGADAGGVIAIDAGVEASAAADAATGCTQALEDALGVACSAPGECGCAAPYCAVIPGQSAGYCTTQDCDPAADDCPSGYMCFDLSSVGVSGVPTFCVKQ